MKHLKFFENLRIVLFAVVMIAGCVLGFCLTLRPTESDSEMRTLAEFPDFTWKEFLDGTYTSNINLWYSDTFPFREELLAANTHLRGFYGLRYTSAGGGGTADFIDPEESFVWDTSPDLPPDNPPDSTSPDESESETEPSNPPDLGHEVIEGYLVEGNTGYELYYFNKANSDRYARQVVQAALRLDGKAQVYCLVTPMSYAYGVSDKTQAELGASNCQDSIDYMYRAIKAYCEQAGVQNPVITVDAYGALEAHADEYLFFRTDHHWTALGAHYASRTFLDLAGKDYPSLSEGYREIRIEGFTGSLAGHTKQETPNLINNPDTIYAYIPNSVNTVTITPKADQDGNIIPFEAPVVNENAASKFGPSSRYRCFIDGDYPFSVVHNEAVGDGSAILLIKESYGNAFVPMLVDSYEYVYAVDYRFFRTMSLEEVVDTYQIDTVLFVNNPVATSADYNMNCLQNMMNVKSKKEDS